MDAKRIVIRAPNWVGDSVLTLPAVNSLKHAFPESELWVAAYPRVKDLFAMSGLCDGLIPLPAATRLKALRQGALALSEAHFGVGVLLSNSFASALQLYWARIPEHWGYSRDGRGFLLTRRVRSRHKPDRRHQVDEYLDLIAGLGIARRAEGPKLPLDPEEKMRAETRLHALNISPERPVVILNPGAFYGPAKRWPTSRFAALAESLQKSHRTQVLIVGSAQDVPLAEEVSSQMDEKPVILAGKTTLPELAALISLCQVFITNDSGPMHIANAIGVPVVAIFGPTDPSKTGPYSPPRAIFHKPVVCWPCLYRECPFDHRCMRSITVEEVATQCQEFLR